MWNKEKFVLFKQYDFIGLLLLNWVNIKNVFVIESYF